MICFEDSKKSKSSCYTCYSMLCRPPLSPKPRRGVLHQKNEEVTFVASTDPHFLVQVCELQLAEWRGGQLSAMVGEEEEKKSSSPSCGVGRLDGDQPENFEGFELNLHVRRGVRRVGREVRVHAVEGRGRLLVPCLARNRVDGLVDGPGRPQHGTARRRARSEARGRQQGGGDSPAVFAEDDTAGGVHQLPLSVREVAPQRVLRRVDPLEGGREAFHLLLLFVTGQQPPLERRDCTQ